MVDGRPRGIEVPLKDTHPGAMVAFCTWRFGEDLAPEKVARGGHGDAEVQRVLDVLRDVEKVLLGLAAAFRRWCRQRVSNAGRRKNRW
jgi:hypothetical protein